MVGVGETYLPAFALAYGLGEISAGLVATAPMLAGAVLQLVAPAAVLRLRSYRRWIVGAALVQALIFIPLAIAALTHALPRAAIFGLAAAYWGAGMASGPAWNSWIATLVPPRLRARYFARRSHLAQGAVLVGLLGGGTILHAAADRGHALVGFAILFGIACVARIISTVFLARQSEPEPPSSEHRDVSWREILPRLRQRSDGRLLAYLVATQLAVQLSAPYFTPFMLGELKLSYVEYMTLISTSFVAKILAYPWLGRVAERSGARRLLALGGVGIVPLAALWLVSHHYGYLLAVQCFAGIAWGAFELGSFLLLFDAIADRERTSILTAYNVAHASATVGGAALGGTLMALLGSDHSGYGLLFGMSSVLRAGVLIFLSRVEPSKEGPLPALATRTDAVRPSAGSIERPVVASLPPRRRDQR